MHYKYIFCYETGLQKKIIDLLIEEEKVENFLIIDARGHSIKIDETHLDINFNKPALWFRSLAELKLFKNLNLSADYYVGTLFTGHNAIFLANFFKASKFLLIDDGIGTPVQLAGDIFLEKGLKFKAKFWLIKFFLFLNGISYLSIKKLLNNVSKYYTVYKKSAFFEDTHYIELIREPIKILKGTLLIGSPLIEFGILSKQSYLDIISEVVERFGEVIYYPHPDESYIFNKNIEGVEVINPSKNVEEFIIEHGACSITLSFSSSAMLNLANYFIENNSIEFFSIKVNIYGQKYDHYYEQIEKSYNIKILDFR